MTVAHIRTAEVETFSLDWGGEEQALTALPDFTRHPAGEIVSWHRAAPDPGT